LWKEVEWFRGKKKGSNIEEEARAKKEDDWLRQKGKKQRY